MNIINYLLFINSIILIYMSIRLYKTTKKYVELKGSYNYQVRINKCLREEKDKLKFNKDMEKLSNMTLEASYNRKVEMIKRFYQRKSNIKEMLRGLEVRINAAPRGEAEEIRQLTDTYLKLLQEYKEG